MAVPEDATLALIPVFPLLVLHRVATLKELFHGSLLCHDDFTSASCL